MLTDELAKIAADAALESIGEQETRNRRKVLLFSYFTDTVDWVFEHLVDVATRVHRTTSGPGGVP